MKLSIKCDYALKCLLDLALHRQEKSVHIEDIALRQNIPLKFLQSIILSLKKGGFVDSKKGPGGGYFLVLKPHEITMSAVLRYIEGTLEIMRYEDPSEIALSNGSKEFKHRVNEYVLGGLWKKMGEAISKTCDEITLEDLVRDYERVVKPNENEMYYI